MRATIDKQSNGDRLVRVWIDERKRIDGEPDPAYVREWTWGPPPDEFDGTDGDYETMILSEVKGLAQAELNATRTSEEPEVAPLSKGVKL
jgi:hypothetical protein